MSDVPEKLLGSHRISLINSDGELLDATVELGCKDWNEGGCRRTECRIKLTWGSGQIECIDFQFFESFKRIREQLAEQDLLPLCMELAAKSS